MKAGLVVLLFLFAFIECRKTYTPIDKNANLAFINMESGGTRAQPNAPPAQPQANAQPPAKEPATPPNKPASQTPTPTKPSPVVTPITIKPTPVKPVQPSGPIKPSQTINPTPVTTPGPGSVKSLVNFYDSQGKGSVIRPYSYSQAVKQG